jgi:hypothetical protein
MEIREVDNIEFEKTFYKPDIVFNSPVFNNLNREKVSKVKYLVFLKENKAITGIIGGVKDGTFSSPYSAPFGGWNFHASLDIEDLESAYDLLEKYLHDQQIKKIKITLPPFFYNETGWSLVLNVSYRRNYSIISSDLNFQFRLSKFNDDYLQNIAYNARKNYNAGKRAGLCFDKVIEPGKIREAYDVISENRKQRGFPLKMSFEDILDTSKVIDADFFIVTDSMQKNAAAAMVFKVTDSIVQVVYWGHLSAFSSLKPINFLSYNVFDYYKKIGKEFVDIGPSTENSVPNYGLIEFKRSIGCDISSKLTLEKKLQ